MMLQGSGHKPGDFGFDVFGLDNSEHASNHMLKPHSPGLLPKSIESSKSTSIKSFLESIAEEDN